MNEKLKPWNLLKMTDKLKTKKINAKVHNRRMFHSKIGKGLFGNIYDQFKGKVQEAFDFLLKHKAVTYWAFFIAKEWGH